MSAHFVWPKPELGDELWRGWARRVGLRKPKPRLSIGLLQVLSDEQAAQIRQHGHLIGYTPALSFTEQEADRNARDES